MTIDKPREVLSLSNAALIASGVEPVFAACLGDVAVEAIQADTPTEPVGVESVEDGLCA